MATSSQPFVSTMVLKALILVMFLPFIAPQCMDYEGMKDCSSDGHDNVNTKDLLECINDCLVKTGKVCRFIQWEPETKQCHVGIAYLNFQNVGKCATFRKTPCSTIPDDGSLENDSGNIFKEGQQMTFVASLEECKTVFALSSTCFAFTWLNEGRQCMIHHQSWDRSTRKLRQGDYQVIKGNNQRGRCVVLNAGGSSPQGAQSGWSLKECVETVLNKSRINRVDWNFGHEDCWSHSAPKKTNLFPVEGLMQLQKHQGCRMWQGAVRLRKLEHTKMSGGMKLNRISEQECVQLCELISNCAAVGWSDGWRGCTFHYLELPTEEDSGNTLYIADGDGITTSTTTVSTTTAITTVSTSTEATTVAPTNVIGTFLGAFFIRRDNNLLTSKYQRRAALECAILCFRSNCSDFSSTISNDDSVCGMNGSYTSGRSPKPHFEWIKL